jgi:hypothetical protein
VCSLVSQFRDAKWRGSIRVLQLRVFFRRACVYPTYGLRLVRVRTALPIPPLTLAMIMKQQTSICDLWNSWAEIPRARVRVCTGWLRTEQLRTEQLLRCTAKFSKVCTVLYSSTVTL